MAIEYSLMLDTQKTVRELTDLCRSAGTISGEESLRHGLAFWLFGLRCTVTTVDDRSREIYQESFGITPPVRVGFRIDKDDPERTMADMKRVLVMLLHSVPGEAILVRNGEHVMLRRTGRLALINQQWINDGFSSFGDLVEELGAGWAIGPDPGPVS